MCTLVLSGCELAAGTGPRRAAWGLVGVAEDDRAVVVRVGHGPCEAVDGVEALESTGGVEVTVRLAPTVPPDGCGDVLVVDTVAATLTAPLDGRRLTGCLRPSCTEADPDRLLTGPVDVVDVAGDAVVVADDRDVRALDRDTGEPRWERSAEELDVRVGASARPRRPTGTRSPSCTAAAARPSRWTWRPASRGGASARTRTPSPAWTAPSSRTRWRTGR